MPEGLGLSQNGAFGRPGPSSEAWAAVGGPSELRRWTARPPDPPLLLPARPTQHQPCQLFNFLSTFRELPKTCFMLDPKVTFRNHVAETVHRVVTFKKLEEVAETRQKQVGAIIVFCSFADDLSSADSQSFHCRHADRIVGFGTLSEQIAKDPAILTWGGWTSSALSSVCALSLSFPEGDGQGSCCLLQESQHESGSALQRWLPVWVVALE